MAPRTMYQIGSSTPRKSANVGENGVAQSYRENNIGHGKMATTTKLPEMVSGVGPIIE